MAAISSDKEPLNIVSENKKPFKMATVRKWATSYALLSPFLILFIVFMIYPMARSFYLSLTEFNGIKPPEWIGLAHYIELLTDDKRFAKAMQNVTVYVAAVVTFNTMLSLGLAMAFKGESRFNQIMRVVFFLPSVTSSIAVMLIWVWIFQGESYGLANTVRSWMGLESLNFLSTPRLAVPILIMMALWGGMGYGMVLFLAGLNAIPQDLYEAAAIDGVTPWTRFRFLTLPLLRPITLYVVITGIIGAFQVFEAVYIVFRSVGSIGGVLDSALMIVPYLYDRGFNRFELGYASAIAWVLFAIIFMISLINLRIGRVNEQY